MARDALARFLWELLRRPDLKATLDPLAGEELVQAAVRAGASIGCPFSPADFRAAVQAAAARRSPGAELSEQQLEAVSGGGVKASGGQQQKYMEIKLTEIMVSSYN
jgi:hypothetical protein